MKLGEVEKYRCEECGLTFEVKLVEKMPQQPDDCGMVQSCPFCGDTEINLPPKK
jgi:predicted RNA-binding Zn-ribbon protein involved in translation (DUF1610 family)